MPKLKDFLPKKESTHLVQARIPEELHQELEGLAQALGVSNAAVIEQALRFYLESYAEEFETKGRRGSE